MKNKVIVFVTMSLWNEPHRGRHHLAKCLANYNKVIWVNRQYNYKEKLRRVGIEHINHGLYVLHTGLAWLPPRYDKRLNINNNFRLNMLRNEIKRLGFSAVPDLVWIYDYKAIQFAGYFNNKSKTIYFCNDYFGEYAYQKYEKNLAQKVDHVFCTAPKLQKRLFKYNPSCFFIPHGTWTKVKHDQAIEKKEKPEILGYIGTLRNVIDVTFLWDILKNTDLTLVLAGPIIECSAEIRQEFENLFKHERVSYLGSLNQSESNEAMNNIDVLLLPYICSYKTQHNFVIKFFDYLATGKPIVATPYFEWPDKYKKFVDVYDYKTERGTYFKEVYNNWNQEIVSTAKILASESTWENRIEQINKIVFTETKYMLMGK